MQPVEALANSELIQEFVAAARRLRLKQVDAAKLAGVGQSTASEWWRGVYRDLRPDTREALEGLVRRVRDGEDIRHASGPTVNPPPHLGWEAGENSVDADHPFDATDPFMEVMLREARAAERRAEAALKWATWLASEASSRATAHEMMREERRERAARRAMRAPVTPVSPPGGGEVAGEGQKRPA